VRPPPSTVSTRAAHAAKGGPEWRVTALRYATIKAFPFTSWWAGADTARRSDIAMMFWLLDGLRDGTAGGRRVPQPRSSSTRGIPLTT
jgi:hypothetical protein